MNGFLRKLRWLTRRGRKEAELREELEFHLEAEAEERQVAGLPEVQAREAAHRELWKPDVTPRGHSCHVGMDCC